MQVFIDTLAASFDGWLTMLIRYLPRIVAAVIVLVVTLVGARWFGEWVQRGLRRVRGLPASAVGLLTSMARAAALVLGLLAVLQVLDLGQIVVSAIASLGIVGLIVGFALQDVTKQFASGMILLLTRPFDIGDTIRIGVHEGTVVNLQLRVTVLKTAGGDEVLIPNADVYASTVYNMSRYPQRRLAVPFTLPQTEQIEALRAQILSEVAKLPGVLADPPPSVVSTGAVDQKISAEVRFWMARDATKQDEAMTQVIALVSRALQTVEQ